MHGFKQRLAAAGGIGCRCAWFSPNDILSTTAGLTMNRWLVSVSIVLAVTAGSVQAAGNADAGKTKSATCLACHGPDGSDTQAVQFDLTATNAYRNLIAFAESDLEKLAFEKDRSVAGECPARRSKLLALLAHDANHQDVLLDKNSLARLVTWMDTYAHRQGSFSPEQEAQLVALRQRYRHLFEE